MENERLRYTGLKNYQQFIQTKQALQIKSDAYMKLEREQRSHEAMRNADQMKIQKLQIENQSLLLNKSQFQDKDSMLINSKLQNQVKLLASENERLIGLKNQGVGNYEGQLKKLDKDLQVQLEAMVQEKVKIYEQRCSKFEKQIKEVQDYYESKILLFQSSQKNAPQRINQSELEKELELAHKAHQQQSEKYLKENQLLKREVEISKKQIAELLRVRDALQSEKTINQEKQLL